LPTKNQLQKLANFLEIPYEDLMVAWLKEKIWKEVKNEPYLSETLQSLNERVARYFPNIGLEAISRYIQILGG
jgi:hypothetical protein